MAEPSTPHDPVPERRTFSQLFAVGLATLVLGCSPADEEHTGKGASDDLGGASRTGLQEGGLPGGHLRDSRAPLAALVRDIAASSRALVAAAEPDAEAWLAAAIVRLKALPRIESERLRGPSRVRFGDNHGRGPVTLKHVRIEDGGSLPAHQRRQMCGAIFGLSGRLHVTQYELVVPALLSDPEQPFVVRQTLRGVLLPGQTFTYTRTRNTILSVLADGSGGEYLDLSLRFSDTSGAQVLHVEAEPLDLEGKLYGARWSGIGP